ncbi:MAG: hypothetical protein GY937_16210 [bacterium]|nr:hypothetical protein [bacterium]
MLSRNVWIRTGLGIALVALAAAPASAGTAYRYTAADGSLAFTDDLERVPEARREATDVVDTKPLSEYSRLSPTHLAAAEEQIARLEERSEHLRKIISFSNAERLATAAARNGHPSATGPGSAPGYQATVEVDGATIQLPAAGTGDGPIVVEQVRSVRKGKNITQMSTVVRQGDEVLMVVFPSPHLQINSNDFVREDDLLEGR